MSVAAVTSVWKDSSAKGADLLVLLAIADYAEDDGRNSWATETKLATKSRMTERGVRNILRRLVKMGELAIEKNDGGRRVKDGHVPRRFMHVLCCPCEPERRSGSQPEKRSGSTGKAFRFNRKSVPVEPEQISGSINGPTGTNRYSEPERTGTAYKEDPSGSVKEHTTRARDGRRPHPLDEPIVLEPKSLALFDELWSIYPRKDRQVVALEAWRTLNPPLDVGGLIVAHVRIRLRTTWRDLAPRYVPQLGRFLAERRWQERDVGASASSRGAPSTEGILTLRLCPTCGEEQEGCVTHGAAVYPPCPRCARAGSESARECGGLTS